MLRYDAAWLLERYADEVPVLPGVPYTRIGGAGPYETLRAEGEFRLTPVVDLKPQLDYDETVVRLAGCDAGTLLVQPSAYSEGVKSNYAMDGPGGLRDILRADYGARLPPLADTRLSNAIGTAIVVFDGDGRPCLPLRAPRQQVFPDGYHCTASGETVWREGALTFEALFTGNICRELEEEVGLERADLEWIRPLALCREYLRGGKPQFFFAGRTKLRADELRKRRRAAIARQVAVGKQEVLDDSECMVRPELCTLECRANLVLAGWENHTG